MAVNETFVQTMTTGELGIVRELGWVAYDYLSSSRYPKLIGIVLLWFWALSFFQPKRPGIPNAPVHGSRGFWEPEFVLKTRFIYDAYSIISSGFEKYKNRPFILRRHDTDINVLPMKYLDELRLVPREELNGKMVHYNNIFRSWPWASVISESDLHVTVLTRKLNPDLPRYVELARAELDYGWDRDVPQNNDWAVVDIQGVMRKLVARMSAKVFLGEPVCRDPTWLDLTISFTVDIFVASFALRAFPHWSHVLVKPLIPSRWRVQRQIKTGTEVVRSLMAERDAGQVGTGSRVSGKGTLFDWMIDNAVGNEGTLTEMAARQCILTLASIHTTATTVANSLFDLIVHPEWVDVLRKEIQETTNKYGDLGQNDSTKSWLNNLEKMDSFIVESQRAHPPILLTPQRIAMVPITLKDGTHIPVGTRVAWAGPQHSSDPRTTPDPAKFDPMRNYRKRHAGTDGENLNRFMAGQTDRDNMSFGYGNQICPGRYFAIFEIKMMLMRLLQAFDFAAPPGKGKNWSRTIYADENVILDPFAKVMMRKRQNTG